MTTKDSELWVQTVQEERHIIHIEFELIKLKDVLARVKVLTATWAITLIKMKHYLETFSPFCFLEANPLLLGF